ncbi:hypothetical protein AB0H76_29240 [Nocardia sp. NPDC050712]|uniref:hypothetical protein n=1 Tax=Nocardia sp. NPDC050712 TaxID=3155518 RepID=UPI0033BFF79A
MNFSVDFGVLQIAMILFLLLGLALLVSALVKVRRVGGMRILLGRGASGLALMVVAVTLLWFATLMQTYLGLTGETKAAHAVVKEVPGQEHQLDVDLTIFGQDGEPDRKEKYLVEGDQWVMQSNIVELHPWVNALGFHSGYKLSRLFGQRTDGEPTTQRHIFLNGSDKDFFDDMREGEWYTKPFIRSAYGNAVIAVPGEWDIYISHDAIKTRAPN